MQFALADPIAERRQCHRRTEALPSPAGPCGSLPDMPGAAPEPRTRLTHALQAVAGLLVLHLVSEGV